MRLTVPVALGLFHCISWWLKTKNQRPNTKFLYLFLLQFSGLFSFQIATTTTTKKLEFDIWFLANSWCNETNISDDALEKEGLIMETSTNPNGISNGVSSDNLYIKFQKGISQYETGKVIHPKCYKNSNESFCFWADWLLGRHGSTENFLLLIWGCFFLISSWAEQVQN